MLYLKNENISNSGMGETVRPCIHRCCKPMIIFQSSNISTFLIKMKIMAKIEECMHYSKELLRNQKTKPISIFLGSLVVCAQLFLASGYLMVWGIGYKW